MQPYRHVGPLAFVALLPAAALVETAMRERWLSTWPRTARITAAGLACTTLAWCMRDVLYFTVMSGACGLCDACRLRAKGFEEAGLADPTRYAEA